MSTESRAGEPIRFKGAFQDGGDFYREMTPAEETAEWAGGDMPRTVVIASYPGMVTHDHDLAGARRARARFAAEFPAFVEGAP